MPRLSGPLKMNLSPPQIYLDLVRLFFHQANLSILPQFVRVGFHSFSAAWGKFDVSTGQPFLEHLFESKINGSYWTFYPTNLFRFSEIILSES